jgi:intein/homing endonuclease
MTQNGIFSIKKLEEYDYNLPVYNFTVDKYHTYIADTCIVHNTEVVVPTK